MPGIRGLSGQHGFLPVGRPDQASSPAVSLHRALQPRPGPSRPGCPLAGAGSVLPRRTCGVLTLRMGPHLRQGPRLARGPWSSPTGVPVREEGMRTPGGTVGRPREDTGRGRSGRPAAEEGGLGMRPTLRPPDCWPLSSNWEKTLFCGSGRPLRGAV